MTSTIFSIPRLNLFRCFNNDKSDSKEEEDSNQTLIIEDDDQGPSYPVVDSDVQNELMTMNPFERLEAIDELIQQAVGEALDGNDVGDADQMDAIGSSWFECDLQNLRILKAITLESLGQSDKALQIWEECVQFTETKMPPNDENSIAMRVQAALCSKNLDKEMLAQHHASVALQRHNLMFGGGVRRFRRRYRQEFRLNLRSNIGSGDNKSFEDMLWPY